MRLLILFSVAIVIVLLLVLTRPESKAELQPYPSPVVDFTAVEQQDVRPFVIKTGRLQPARKAQLRFEVSGRVVERYVEPGQHVVRGEPLLRVDEGDYRDTLLDIEARVNQERQAIERDRKLLELVTQERKLQQREVERLEQLGRDALSSKSAYDEAMRRQLQYEAEEARLRYSVETAEARLQSRSAELNRALRDLERTRLTAPFDATVNAVELEVGDYVTTGQAAIELVQLDSLDLYLEVTSILASSLSLGEKVDIHVGDETRKGLIIALSADPDPVTNTHPLRIRTERDGLLPGLIARVELPEPFISDALLVPVTSVLQEGGNAYVFRVDDNRLVRTRVDLAKRFRGHWIVDGVEAGARIVKDDVAALADGQEVTLSSRN
ncbi:MAG: efflux RND transporter periplasmic adaptor subunit [Gammaproteobacteria bacterium]